MSLEGYRQRGSRTLFVAVSIACALGLVVMYQTGWLERQPGLILEAGIYLGMAMLLASRPVISDDLFALPKAHRITLVALLGIAVLAQFVGGGGDVYPGARWAMFSDLVPDVYSRVVIVTLSDETDIVVDPADLYGALRNGRGGSLVGRAIDSGEIESLLGAFANRYEELHTDQEVISIRAVDIELIDVEALQGSIVRTTRAEVRP